MSGRPKRAPKRSKKYENEVDDFDSEGGSDVPLSDSDSEDRKPRKKAPARGKKQLESFTTDEGWTFEPPSLLYKEFGDAQPNEKIAAFDLDGTMVNTKSGAPFAKDDLDWKWYNKAAAEKIQQYSDDNYKIVIFTNQGSIKSAVKGKASEKILARIDSIMDELGVPAQVFACTMDDHFRKPNRGMWDFFCQRFNGGIQPDLSKCFFVGDAAGRAGDFADTDKGFADAVGIAFRTPEDEFGAMEGKRALPPGMLRKPKGGDGGGEEACVNPANAGLVSMMSQLADKAFEDAKIEPKYKFKGAAFKKVAAVLANYPDAVSMNNIKTVGNLQGVGKGSIGKIKEFLETGTCAELEGIDDLAGVGKAAPQMQDAGRAMAANFM